MFVILLKAIYFIFTFIILILISIAYPRVTQNPKLPKNTGFFLFSFYYITSIIILVYVFDFSLFFAIMIKVFYLISAQFLGLKLRIIGLSGQICSGKTTAAEFFRHKYNAVIIDYKEILISVLRKPDVRVNIRKDFGDQLFKNIKNLEYDEEQFKKFINSNKVNQIGHIINKYIIQDILLRILQEKIYFNTKHVFLENAFLLRSSFLKYLCFPILSICSDIGYAPIIRRAMNKYKCDRDEATEVYLSNQSTLLEYKYLSDYVILNNGTIDHFIEQLDKFMKNDLKI